MSSKRLKPVHFRDNAFSEPPNTGCGKLDERGDYTNNLGKVDCEECRLNPVYLGKLAQATILWSALIEELGAAHPKLQAARVWGAKETANQH